MKHFIALMMLAMCCILFIGVHGLPGAILESDAISLNRTKRHYWDREHGSVNNLFGRGGFMYNKCVDVFGCYDGFCWARCTRVGVSFFSYEEWCYTENEEKPARCKTRSDCHGCWNCRGACTLTNFFNP